MGQAVKRIKGGRAGRGQGKYLFEEARILSVMSETPTASQMLEHQLLAQSKIRPARARDKFVFWFLLLCWERTTITYLNDQFSSYVEVAWVPSILREGFWIEEKVPSDQNQSLQLTSEGKNF